jgi:predicted alpha/beta hydrolase family esterase
MEKTQILMVHGGMVFENKEEYYKFLLSMEVNPYNNTKGWKSNLQEDLGDNFEVFKPSMPEPNYSDYNAWKIWFEKYFDFLTSKNIILIGHSLGTIFLSKYLTEHTFPKKISQLHLVTPIFSHTPHESIGNFSFDNTKLSNVSKKCEIIFLYHSHDDDIVPFNHSVEYKQRLENSELIEFEDRGHFIDQEHFEELVEKIRGN